MSFTANRFLRRLTGKASSWHCEVWRCNKMAEEACVNASGLAKFVHLLVEKLLYTLGKENFNSRLLHNFGNSCKNIAYAPPRS